MLGPYEISEEVSYLGVYQGISRCNEGKNLEFTAIRWASHSLGRVESRCDVQKSNQFARKAKQSIRQTKKD